MENLLAKSGDDPQTLKTHLLAVGLKCYELANDLLSDEYKSSTNQSLKEQLRLIVSLSGLLHDIGKVDKGFQTKIKMKNSDKFDLIENEDCRIDKKYSYKGPFHHEISSLIYKKLYKEPFLGNKNGIFSYGNKNIISVNYLIYHHHPTHLDFENFLPRLNTYSKIGSYFDKEALEEMFKTSENLINEVVSSFEIITKTSLSQYLIRDLSEKDFNQNTPAFNFEGDYSNQNFNMGDESVKKLLLTILIEADVIISKMNESEAVKYINEFTTKESLIPNRNWKLKSEISHRTKCQINLADKMNNYKISIVGVDTGGGKTLLSMAASKSKLTTIILPKINQVDALDIQMNASILFDEKIITKRIHSKSDDQIEDNDDVRIMVFDQALSSLFDRRYHQIGFDLLSSDLIVDEFHDFATIPSMVIPLKVFLGMRRLLKAKTFLLSGTPDRGLLNLILPDQWEGKNDIGFFSREELPPTKSGQYEDISIEYSDYKSLSNIGSDSLVTFNSTSSAQRLKIQTSVESILCHSKFQTSEIKENISRVENHYKKGCVGGLLVISPKMLSSSYDFAFKNVFNIISTPAIDTQTMGRCNRHQSKKDSKFVFIQDEKISKYISNSLGLTKTHVAWSRFLQEELSLPLKKNHREFAIDIYEKFFKNQKNLEVYQNEVFEISRKSYLKIYNRWFPIKGKSAPKSKVKYEGEYKKVSDFGFRGTNCFVSMKMIDPLTFVPIKQLEDGDCLSLPSGHLEEELQFATKLWARKHPKGEKRKNKYGYDTNNPYVSSYFESGLDYIDKDLSDKLTPTRSHLVYIEGIGVMDESTYIDLFNSRTTSQ